MIKNNLKKREAYYAKHKTEIEAFKDARDYINTVRSNGQVYRLPVVLKKVTKLFLKPLDII